MTSPVRRTVYQSVPTGGTEKDIHTDTQKETAYLPQDLTTTAVLPYFDVMHLMLLNHLPSIAEGLLSKLKVGITALSKNLWFYRYFCSCTLANVFVPSWIRSGTVRSRSSLKLKKV